jgi:predicted N-acetyltransferase YhbS
MTSPVLIRPAEEADREAIRGVLRAAFESEDEVELVDAIVADRHHVPDLELVAAEDGQVIGHILFSRAEIEEPLPGAITNQTHAVLLAPLSVHPEHQNAGVGSRLVRAGLERAHALGEHVALVLGHPIYYSRFGFSEALQRGIRAPHDVPSEAWMVVELETSTLQDVMGTAKLLPAFDDPKYWRE